MTVNEYQEKAMKTALPNAQNTTYMVLGLVNEAGEVAGVLKKRIRDCTPTQEYYDKLKKELGDVLWYVAGACAMLDMKLEDCAQANLDKLASRQTRGVLGGSGDNR